MTRAERARELFHSGYNCAQAVTAAFADLIGMAEAACARLGSGFGGGMCGRRETCGAVTGMLLAADLIMGKDHPMQPEEKKAFYAQMNALVKAFEEKNGTAVCRDLLGEAANAPAGAARTAEYYANRPCERLVGEAAAILEAVL